MSDRFSLLAPNKTPFENALDLTGARVDELPVDIPKVIDPQSIPLTLLPWLAWSTSADMWREEWTEERKRWVTANSLQWHFKKGTAFLLRKYCAVMGGEVRRLETPPSKTFLMPAFSEDERLKFLRRFPELRVYPYVARAFNKYSHFTNAAFGRRKAFIGKSYVHGNGAWSRYTRTAELRDGGVVTPLTYRTITNELVGNEVVATFEEAVLPARPTDKIMLGDKPKARLYFGDIGYVGERLIRIKRDITLPYTAPREKYTTVAAGLDFINVAPDRIYETHAGQKGALFPSKKRYLSGVYLPKSIAWQFVFERWYLFDKDRLPSQRHRSRHLGYTRLGIPAYWAEAKVRMTGVAAPREAWRYVDGFLRQHSSDNVDRSLQAVRQSKALRDKILVNTKTLRTPRVGDRISLGQLKVGQFIDG